MSTAPLADERLISRLELELRLLAGVICVGATFDEDGRASHLSVVGVDPAPGLVDTVTDLARSHGIDAAVEVVDFDELVEPGSIRTINPSEGRIVLEGAVHDAESGSTEVHLCHDDRKAVGRSVNGPMVGAAEATLDAVGRLGLPVPGYLFTVSRTGGGAGAPIMVVLRPRRGGANCVGLARAASEPEAASRAALSALNRLFGQ